MYNLNLDYYSVEQENHKTDSFAHGPWSSNSKSALNDVVDPNTEFKITPSSVVPASTLESYGLTETPKTKLGAQITKDSTHLIVSKDKRTFAMPASAKGSVAGAQHKPKNSLNILQEIPQVHGSRKKSSAGRISNGTHTTNGTSPTDNALASSRGKQTSESRGKRDAACETESLDDEGTTTSQLAWAFRNARDRADLDSNASRSSSRFDLESSFSERGDTFSTLSGASGHEEELFRIRRLLLLDTARSYQERLLDFDSKPGALNEDTCCPRPGEGPESEWQPVTSEKTRLEEVHAEVEALRRAVRQETTERPHNGLPTDLSAENQRLRVELQELRLDAEGKDGAIRGLKLKVASQHADISALSSRQRAAESRVANDLNDLDAARKSAAFYRDQLQESRATTLRSEQALSAARAAAVSANHTAARLAEEAANQRAAAEDARSRAVAEKDALVRKLEAIHAGMLEREAAILDQLRRERLAEPAPVHARPRGSSESEPQVAALRSALVAREAEEAELRADLARLQAEASESEAARHSLLDHLQQLTASRDAFVERLAAGEATALRTATEKAALEAALSTATNEKAEVDAAVDRLREDFARLESQYQAMQGQRPVVAEATGLEAGLRALLVKLSEVDECFSLLHEPSVAMDDLRLRLRLAGGGTLKALVQSLLGETATSGREAANQKEGATGFAEGRLESEPTGPSLCAECAHLRAECVRLRAESADTLDGVRVALGRSEAMGGVLRTSVARLQRDLEAEQVAHESVKAECERLRLELQAQADFPPDWEAELATLRADKMALQAQVGELRDATQSTLQLNKVLRLRLETLSRPPSVDRLPPPPPPALCDDGAIAALMQSTARDLPRNEPLAELQGCLDSLKTEMATLQQQLMAKARGEAPGVP